MAEEAEFFTSSSSSEPRRSKFPSVKLFEANQGNPLATHGDLFKIRNRIYSYVWTLHPRNHHPPHKPDFIVTADEVFRNWPIGQSSEPDGESSLLFVNKRISHDFARYVYQNSTVQIEVNFPRRLFGYYGNLSRKMDSMSKNFCEFSRIIDVTVRFCHLAKDPLDSKSARKSLTSVADFLDRCNMIAKQGKTKIIAVFSTDEVQDRALAATAVPFYNNEFTGWTLVGKDASTGKMFDISPEWIQYCDEKAADARNKLRTGERSVVKAQVIEDTKDDADIEDDRDSNDPRKAKTDKNGTIKGDKMSTETLKANAVGASLAENDKQAGQVRQPRHNQPEKQAKAEKTAKKRRRHKNRTRLRQSVLDKSSEALKDLEEPPRTEADRTDKRAKEAEASTGLGASTESKQSAEHDNATVALATKTLEALTMNEKKGSGESQVVETDNIDDKVQKADENEAPTIDESGETDNESEES